MSETTDGEIFWFMIGEKATRFSISEFVLVTVFKVGDDTKTNKTPIKAPRLVSKYLKGSVNRKGVLDAFNDCNDDQTDNYKLGLIVILSYVVMGSEENTKMQWWRFDVVDDLEKFNEHPWGNSSYKLTTNLLRRNMTSTFYGNKNYSLHGFPMSIMVWALEVIPAIALLAEKVAVENVPRFLN